MKTTLQEKIASGEIGSMAQLLSYVSDQGWKVTRNGVDYLGIENALGKRFRVRFPFPNDTRSAVLKVPREAKKNRPQLLPGYWIYGLFAHAREERACYIGQAVDYLHRVKGHMRDRPGRSSWDLFQWAEPRNATVQFALLDFLPGQPRTPKLAAEATTLEGLWLHRAQAAGYLTPGSERWGRLPKFISRENFLWPADDIAHICRPLAVVFAEQLPPAELAILSVRETYQALVEEV